MKKFVISIFSLIICAICATPAFAAPAATPDNAAVTTNEYGVDDATWAALNDNNLEYAELDNLVRYFNPSIVNAYKQVADGAKEISDSRDELDEGIEQLEGGVKELKGMIDKYPAGTAPAELVTQYETLRVQLETLKATKKALKSTYKSLTDENGSAMRGLNRAKDQVVRACKSLMIGYKTLVTQKALLEQLASLNQESYNCYVAMRAVGMASDTDVLKAQADLLSAQSSLSALKGTEQQLYNQLKLMCGWNENALPVIGEIPAADIGRMAAYNPEADYIYAAGNSPQMSSVRSGKAKGGAGLNEASQEALTAQIHAQLVSKYNAINAARADYDAAKAGFESAKITWNAAQIQYQSGLISKVQYLGIKTQYVQKEAAFKCADMALTQAMNDYGAAVEGGL